MMILKHGRIQNGNLGNMSKFHYFPPDVKEGKSKKNSKSRTRYAEYDQNDETMGELGNFEE